MKKLHCFMSLLAILLALTACSGDSLPPDDTEIPDGSEQIHIHTEEIIYGKEPSCTESGLTDGKSCCVCGEITVQQKLIRPLGHNLTEYKEKDPTCTDEGWDEYESCSRCDYTTLDKLPANGHSYSKKDTCTACGIFNPDHKHTEEADKAVEATCIKAGLTEGSHCSVCNEVIVPQITTDALGHVELIKKGYAPTCTQNGLSDGKYCTRCGETTLNQMTLAVKGHDKHVVFGYAATCTAPGMSDGLKCLTCGEVFEKQNVINVLGHDKEIISGYPATCTKSGLSDGTYCLVCGETVLAQKTLNSPGHSRVYLKAVAATCTSPGFSSGSECSVCGEVLSAQTVIPAKGHKKTTPIIKKPSWSTSGSKSDVSCTVCGEYFSYYCTLPAIEEMNGSYGYEQLGALPNGYGLCALYNDMDAKCESFHNNTSLNALNGVLCTFNFAKYGLSLDDALSVWCVYKYDHPLYYWISNTVSHTNSTLSLLVDSEYIYGWDRSRYNELIYNGIWNMYVEDYSHYRKAMAYHDMILDGMEYAFKSDGETPEDAAFAHNILGYFQYGKGVCETYAELFHLMLLYSGIESVYVVGDAGGPHAWNLAKMDDGRWYWFDLTWDDTLKIGYGNELWKWGINYNFFCVNDTENTLWGEGGEDFGYTEGFTDKHKPQTTDGKGTDFLYELPERSRFKYSDFAWDEYYGYEFIQDGCKFTIVGYNLVELVSIEGSGTVCIPQEIDYWGNIYTVISIGDRSGRDLAVISSDVRTLIIPETVKHIWDGAFGRSITLENIYIHPDNEVFSSNNGIVYKNGEYFYSI